MKQLDFEYKLDTQLIAGVDEAGRGPLAGPVIAAAVILNHKQGIAELRDSKILTEKKRYKLANEIRDKSITWGTGRAEVEEIDKINILNASLLAMQRAINALNVVPDTVLVDGLHCPELTCNVRSVVKGDKLIPVISAASILAKVTRDEDMIAMDKKYPGYGFAQHKGYPTKQHIIALERLGICAIHRRSYAPVQRFL